MVQHLMRSTLIDPDSWRFVTCALRRKGSNVEGVRQFIEDGRAAIYRKHSSLISSTRPSNEADHSTSSVSNLVWGTQYRRVLSFGPLQIPHRRRGGTTHILCTHGPTQRTFFVSDRRLQKCQSFHKSVRPRWTAWHVKVYRQKLIDALNDAVDVVHST